MQYWQLNRRFLIRNRFKDLFWCQSKVAVIGRCIDEVDDVRNRLMFPERSREYSTSRSISCYLSVLLFIQRLLNIWSQQQTRYEDGSVNVHPTRFLFPVLCLNETSDVPLACGWRPRLCPRGHLQANECIRTICLSSSSSRRVPTTRRVICFTTCRSPLVLICRQQ